MTKARQDDQSRTLYCSWGCSRTRPCLQGPAAACSTSSRHLFGYISCTTLRPLTRVSRTIPLWLADGDAAAEQLRQFFDDCEPQASAAVCSVRIAFNLPEPLEDQLSARGVLKPFKIFMKERHFDRCQQHKSRIVFKCNRLPRWNGNVQKRKQVRCQF
jgi:hypothetical protein